MPLKQKRISSTQLRKTRSIKKRVELIVLFALVGLLVLAQTTGFFSFMYSYVYCEDLPLEVEGNIYRLPGDEGYGFHPGNNYSYCIYEKPPGSIRDPSTTLGAIQQRKKTMNETVPYVIYIPSGYKVSNYQQSGGYGDIRIHYSVTGNKGTSFRVREVKKGSDFSYADLCTKPPSPNWSGTFVGKDSAGRDICKTNLSKYVSNYVVGINVGDTAIMLEAPLGQEEQLTEEATAIFSSMQPKHD